MSKQSDPHNHANQLNPNNHAYWQSRGWEERPDDWEERIGGQTNTDQKEELSSKNQAKR